MTAMEKLLVGMMGGGLLLLAGCDSGSGEPPSLPGKKDGGVDAATDAKADDDGGVDAGNDAPPPQGDGGVSGDAPLQADAPLQTDAFQHDAGADAAGQQDASASSDAAAKSSYACQLSVTDKYGMRYGMLIETKDQVGVSASGWSGDVWYKAVSGTAPAVEDARRNGKAGAWPQDGQSVASSAADLTGTYGAQLQRLAGTNASFRIASYFSSGTAPTVLSTKVVLPVTWEATSGQPEPVAADTSNEAYLSAGEALLVGGACDGTPLCDRFSGSVRVTEAGWPLGVEPTNTFSSIEVSCDRN